MKMTIKILFGLFYLPFIAMAGIIAVLETLFMITIGFTISQGHKWYKDILSGKNVNDFFLWMKKH